YSIFGVSWSDFKEAIPMENRDPVRDGKTLYLDDEIVYLTNGNLQQVFCGRGIVIVEANTAKYNANNACDEPFQGLVYVMGNLDMKGNVTMTGAMVVEGRVEDTSTTDVGGSGNKGERISYSSEALRRAALIVPRSAHVAAVPGTYRQR